MYKHERNTRDSYDSNAASTHTHTINQQVAAAPCYSITLSCELSDSIAASNIQHPMTRSELNQSKMVRYKYHTELTNDLNTAEVRYSASIPVTSITVHANGNKRRTQFPHDEKVYWNGRGLEKNRILVPGLHLEIIGIGFRFIGGGFRFGGLDDFAVFQKKHKHGHRNLSFLLFAAALGCALKMYLLYRLTDWALLEINAFVRCC